MIGLFLAYIGLCDSGIMVSGAQHFNKDFSVIPGSANDLVKDNIFTVGTATKLGNFADPFVIIALVTMALVFILHFLKVKGAAILAMLAAVVMVAIAYAAGAKDADKAFSLQTYNSFNKFGDLSSGM